jgi:hypothetical protein
MDSFLGLRISASGQIRDTDSRIDAVDDNAGLVERESLSELVGEQNLDHF